MCGHSFPPHTFLTPPSGHPALHTQHPHASHCSLHSRPAGPGELPLGSEDILSASVLSASTEQPPSTQEATAELRPHWKCAVGYHNWVLGAAQLGCFPVPKRDCFMPSALSSNSPQVGIEYLGSESPSVLNSAEHNCSARCPRALGATPLRDRLALPREVMPLGEARPSGVGI